MSFFQLIASIMAALPHSRQGVFVCGQSAVYCVLGSVDCAVEVKRCIYAFKI